MVARKATAGTGKKKPRKPKKATRAKAGRPEIKVTNADRERVEILVGGGMSIEDIALSMDMAVNTLKKHFRLELKIGAAKKRAAMLEAMFKAGDGGNVSAQKAYLQHNLLAEADARVQGEKPDKAGETPKPVKAPSGYRGKKEAAQEEAMTAGDGTEWNSDLDPFAPGPDAKPN